MRQLPKLLCLIIVLVLVGCEPGLLPAPTDVSNPTPTQETNYETPTDIVVWPTNTPVPTALPNWNLSCIEDGVIPITERPCPVDTIDPMTFAAYPGANYPDYSPTLECDNGCTVFLHDPGDDGKGRAGRAAIQLHGVQLDEGKLYVSQFNVDLNLNDATDGNFSIGGMVHTDSGNFYDLREHGVNKLVDGRWTRNGLRETWSCIRPLRDTTVVIENWVAAIWATYAPGNSYDVTAIYVYETTNINICGNVVVIE